jgi:hypothetical protein
MGDTVGAEREDGGYSGDKQSEGGGGCSGHKGGDGKVVDGYHGTCCKLQGS